MNFIKIDSTAQIKVFDTEKVISLLQDMYSLAYSSLKKIGITNILGEDEDIIIGQFSIVDMDKFASNYTDVLIELGLATEEQIGVAEYMGIKEDV